MTKSIIGLDIGTKTIKAVEIAQKNNKPMLLAIGEIPVPQNISNSYDSEAMNLKASYIKKLLFDAKMKSKTIISSIASNKISATIITLPSMPKDELNYAMNFQLKKFVPEYPQDKKAYWEVLSDAKRYKILIVGVDNIVVNNYMEIFKRSGLNISSLEIEATALSRILINRNESGLIIHMGSSYTSCILVEGGSLSLLRNVKVGEDDLIMALKSSSVNTQEAKESLYEYGLLKFQNKGNVYSKTKDLMGQITTEAIRSVAYFEERKGQELKKIVLSGAGSFIPNITRFFINEISKDVTLADPWSKIEYQASMDTQKLIELGPRFAVACGLAIKEE